MLEFNSSDDIHIEPGFRGTRRRSGHAFGVADADLRQPSRGRAGVALARQSAMYLAHVAGGLTLTEVGKLFQRDRTTVAHACGVIEDRRDDPTFNRILDLLEWVVIVVASRHGHNVRHIS